MNRALERAGSIFAGWISSCLSCSDSGADDESFHHERSIKQKGAEREMQVCHTQPHLVPPMKLVVYDDLPSPGPPPRAASLQSWVMEGKDLASRASNRASMSFKRRSTAPIRISAPSDFRRVPTFGTTPTGFQPLELDFNTPGHRLPSLPKFDEFDLDGDQPQPIARPPRALSASAEMNSLPRTKTHHRRSSSLHLTRKPVGSGSRRSSLATLEHLLEKPTPVASPLIPHFSTRSSAATGFTTTSLISPVHESFAKDNRPSRTSHDASASSVPRTPPPRASLQDAPLPPIPAEEPRSSDTLPRPPSTPLNRPSTTLSDSPESNPSRTPARSRRVTQWLFPTDGKSIPSPLSSPAKIAPSAKEPRIRSRTLSGSTLASSSTSLTGGAFSASTARTSTGEYRMEKEPDLPFPRPPLSKYAMRLSEDHPYPTIYEGKQQQQQQQQQQQPENDDTQYNYYENYRRSAVGLAF